MEKQETTKRSVGEIVRLAVLVLSCIAMAVFSAVEFRYVQGERLNRLIDALLPLVFGSVAAVLLTVQLKIKLFTLPKRWLFLLPCLLIAVNNFPFASYFSGASVLTAVTVWEVLAFLGYCLCVGIFEECVFRGLVFLIVAEYFPRNKKGLVLTFFLSSVIFGLSHLFNLFAGAGFGATVMQVGYSTLIGGLCAFALIKTQSLFSCILVHAVYDFCGLLLDASFGLGAGVTFTPLTVAMMTVIGVLVGIFVLVSVFRCKDDECEELYRKMGVRTRGKPSAPSDQP